MPTKGSSKTETDLMRPSRIQTGLARCVTWSITQSEVQILCSPPIYTALWESSANPPACHAGDRRFESGQSRQKVFVCGVNASICQGSGWIPDRQGLNLSGCRITVVSVAWDHVARVRLLLLRPINVLIVKLAKTVELHSTGEGSNPSEGTKWRFLLSARKTGSQPVKQGSTP